VVVISQYVFAFYRFPFLKPSDTTDTMTTKNNNNNSILIAVGSSSSSMKVNAAGRNDPHQGDNEIGHGTSFFVDTDTADDDDVLMHQEEKMMMIMGDEEEDDEEVTSVESGGDMEDTMMTMAVLNSLVDHHGDGNPTFEDDDIGDDDDNEDDDVHEANHDDDHRLRLSGDPRPDAAPSSFAATTRSTSMMGRAGRKRVRRDNVNYSKKAAKNQLVAVVPNPLSRPIAPPAALPVLKPGEALLGPPDSATSDCTITTTTTRGEKLVSGDDPKKKVNFSDQLGTSGGGRIRGFSIDLDCK
jgi:hypothetical protein